LGPSPSSYPSYHSSINYFQIQPLSDEYVTPRLYESEKQDGPPSVEQEMKEEKIPQPQLPGLNVSKDVDFEMENQESLLIFGETQSFKKVDSSSRLNKESLTLSQWAGKESSSLSQQVDKENKPQVNPESKTHLQKRTSITIPFKPARKVVRPEAR
jgi:hypothetical protein